MEMHCPAEELDILHPLGEGSFGRVFCVRSKNLEGEEQLLACKFFDSDEASDLHDIAQEISIMQTLRKAVHSYPPPPLVFIHGFHVGLSLQDSISYITMDLCNGGSLSSLLKDFTCLSETEAAAVLSAVARALAFCHEEAHVLHRDIKPANIVFAEEGSFDSACLADFGISVPLDDACTVFYGHPGEGSRAFMAPEAEEYGHYSAVSDTWALGAVLFCMLTGMNPSRPRGSKSVKFDRAGNRWRMLSSNVRSLIQGMLCPEQQNRLTLSQVLQHPWLNQSMDIAAGEQKHVMQACTSSVNSLPVCEPVRCNSASIPETLKAAFSSLSLAENTFAVEPQVPMIGLPLNAGQQVRQAALVC